MATTTTREVTVNKVNGKGFQTGAGDWLNVSKYANDADVPMPIPGQHVVVTLDKAGFVRKIEPVAPVAPPASAAPAEWTAPAPATAVRPERDVIVTRLATLNTATAILSAGGLPVVASEVLALAGQLEAWATR